MRYYPGVSPAIPHTRAGWSRVTHPFAGYPLRDPRDLHVLSTPPAFVLSQDQTLQEILMISSTRTRPSDRSLKPQIASGIMISCFESLAAAHEAPQLN